MRLRSARHLGSAGAALAWLAGLSPPLAAQTPADPALAACVEIGAPADRLACYDKALGRAPAPVVPPAQAANPAGGAPASSSELAPTGAVSYTHLRAHET